MVKKYIKKILTTLYITVSLVMVSTCPAKAQFEIAIGGADIGGLTSNFSAVKSDSGNTSVTEFQLDTSSTSEPEPAFTESIIKTDHSGTIKDNIYIGSINVSGLTYAEAVKRVEGYVSELGNTPFNLISVNDNSETVTANDFGLYWSNKDVLDDALMIGKTGNLIAQYKSVCDLQHEKKVYPLSIGFEKEKIMDNVNKQGHLYNQDPVESLVTRENGKFKVTEGKPGKKVDVNTSTANIMNDLNSWNGEAKTFNLVVKENSTKITEETLNQLTDVIGTYTTGFKSSNADRSGNVRTGCKHLNGKLLLPGEQLSVYGAVSPFTEENGYFMAGSYLNGQVVESLGGGICQVSSTLYNAVLRAELQVDERSPHSMVVTYVDLSSDAAIAGTYKDFKFTNNLDSPIYIEGYTTEDKHITFNIYGKETRPANRTIEFESVETSKTEPVEEKIIADGGQPVGYISTQSAHIGYTGELWKIVKVDGVETERIKVNKSTYHPSPRTATVGTAAADPAISAAIQSAISSGSIDFVKQTISSLSSAAQSASDSPQ